MTSTDPECDGMNRCQAQTAMLRKPGSFCFHTLGSLTVSETRPRGHNAQGEDTAGRERKGSKKRDLSSEHCLGERTLYGWQHSPQNPQARLVHRLHCSFNMVAVKGKVSDGTCNKSIITTSSTEWDTCNLSTAAGGAGI